MIRCMVLNIATGLLFCHSFLAHRMPHTEAQTYTIDVINKKYIYSLSLRILAFGSTFSKGGTTLYSSIWLHLF